MNLTNNIVTCFEFSWSSRNYFTRQVNIKHFLTTIHNLHISSTKQFHKKSITVKIKGLKVSFHHSYSLLAGQAIMSLCSHFCTPNSLLCDYLIAICLICVRWTLPSTDFLWGLSRPWVLLTPLKFVMTTSILIYPILRLKAKILWRVSIDRPTLG